MNIQIIKTAVPLSLIREIADERSGDFVKAVVDVAQEIMAIGGELHADEEVVLVQECGSVRKNVWGINIYPDDLQHYHIEYDSMINIKPQEGNRSRSVGDEAIKIRIKGIVEKLITI